MRYEWAALKDEERNALFAQHVLGLRPGEEFGEFPEHAWEWNEESPENAVWCPRCYVDHRWAKSVKEIAAQDPGPCYQSAPSISHTIAKGEAVIAQRGLEESYLEALRGLVNPYNDRSATGELWEMATASPDVRAHAMLRAVGVRVD